MLSDCFLLSILLFILLQSVLPGILQGDKSDSLLYGSVDNGKKICWNEEFHSKVRMHLMLGLLPTLPDSLIILSKSLITLSLILEFLVQVLMFTVLGGGGC